MIKALLSTADPAKKIILFGLTHENLARLVADEPIKLNLSSLGLPDQEVVIMADKTEQAIVDRLAAVIPILEVRRGDNTDDIVVPGHPHG